MPKLETPFAMTATMELLAPAGSADAGYAALAYGADAVYLGLPAFSARAGAENLAVDDLRAFVGFAHGMERPRRVYVALNTLLQVDDVPHVLESLALVSEIGVDAVIVQDLGLLRIVRTHFPELPIHASTQMAVHNPDGVACAKRLGIGRVILARELSIAEIAAASAVPGVETEAFVHGALCYAYSGLCLLSSHSRGTSGNRGTCSYLCRELFRSDAGRLGHHMSMKDLAAPELLGRLAASGVASVKIEGRKKSPLYVAAATNYYRRSLDGDASPGELVRLASDLNTIFARQQTTLYLERPDREHVLTKAASSHAGAPVGTVDAFVPGGKERDRIRFRLENRPLEKRDGLQIHSEADGLVYGFCLENFWTKGGRGKGMLRAEPGERIEVELPEDHPRIPVGAAVCCNSSMEVKRTYTWSKPRPDLWSACIGVSAGLRVERDRLSATFRFPVHGRTLEATVSRSLDSPLDEARNDPEPTCRTAFSKLGGTVFRMDSFEVENPHRLFVPMATLNDLRRSLVEAAMADLAGARAERVAAIIEAKPHPTPSDAGEAWSVQVDDLSYLNSLDESELADLDEVVLACAQDCEDATFDLAASLRVAEKLRLALPTIARERDLPWVKRMIDTGLAHGVDRWQVANLYGVELLREARPGLDVRADWQLYAMNEYAVAELLEWGLTGMTASPEDTRENLRKLFECYPQLCVPVYQDTPLALSEACPHANATGCASCKDRDRCKLLDLHSDRDDLLAITRHCRTTVVASKPYALATELVDLRSLGARRFRVDFAWRAYEPDHVAEIYRQIRSGRFVGGHVANYRRESI